MLLYQNKFDEQLAQGKLYPVYIIASDEPFWHDEYTNKIINLAEKTNQGYTKDNKVSFDDDNKNLAALEEACSSTGLFAEKVIVILTLKNLKSGALMLASLASCLNNDLLAIVRMPRISKADLKQKSLATLDGVGITTVIYPMNERDAINFIQTRAARMHLDLDVEGAYLIYEAYEGNLGAQIQALHKLDLAGYTNKKLLSKDIIRDQIAADRHFTVFEFKDALIDPEVSPQKRLKILHTLYTEGENISTLIRNAGNAITELLEMRSKLDNGIMLESWFNENPILRVLKTKQILYKKAANSISTKGVLKLSKLICRADLEARFYREQMAMLLLEEICVLRSRSDIELSNHNFELL